MLRGTRVLTGDDAFAYSRAIEMLRRTLIQWKFEEVVVPAIWETSTYTSKLGAEKESQMWVFKDKGGRGVCLIPEVTGLIQEMWRDEWSKTRKSMELFYITRCYRYERPQAGRYREFTQVGVELLGERGGNTFIAQQSLAACINDILDPEDWSLATDVERGIDYYQCSTFEAICPLLGAQKQIAGGGRYAEGVGWAIGLERLLLAKQEKEAK